MNVTVFWCPSAGGPDVIRMMTIAPERTGGPDAVVLVLDDVHLIRNSECRAALSGMGGFCQPNNFYDGRPVMTAEYGVRRSRSRVR